MEDQNVRESAKETLSKLHWHISESLGNSRGKQVLHAAPTAVLRMQMDIKRLKQASAVLALVRGTGHVGGSPEEARY